MDKSHSPYKLVIFDINSYNIIIHGGPVLVLRLGTTSKPFCMILSIIIGVPKQAMGWCPVGLGLVVEDA